MRWFGRVAGLLVVALAVLGPRLRRGASEEAPEEAQARPDPRAGPVPARLRRHVRDDERQAADARRRELRQRLPRAHGVRDRDHAQRHHQRPPARADGLVRRGVPRRRRRARRRRGRDVRLRLARPRPVQQADRPRRLSQARRLPARGLPGDEVHRRGPEELRGLLVQRADGRHLGHVLRPQRGLRRRRLAELPQPDRPQRPRLHRSRPSAAATTSTRRPRSPTGPRRPRRPGCTRSTATASCPARTRSTSAATSGSPTPAWR